MNRFEVRGWVESKEEYMKVKLVEKGLVGVGEFMELRLKVKKDEFGVLEGIECGLKIRDKYVVSGEEWIGMLELDVESKRMFEEVE